MSAIQSTLRALLTALRLGLSRALPLGEAR